jgi:UDP-glucose:(heptosyl)LPS alpha-1,3-glucosyltransferase
LYAASDLFVLPTFYDPFSNACLEAMATGIPILTTMINGVAELITDQHNGFLVQDAGNHAEIVEKMNAFYHSPAKNFLGERARDTVSHLDIDSAIQRMLALYEEIKKS